MSFGFNCNYYSCIFYKNKTNLRSKFHSANELAQKQRDLISILQYILVHTQKLWKRAYNKSVKSYSYTLSKKS